FPCGNTIVTCVAEDRCGNKDLCRFQVNIQPGGQPPAIQCPPEMVINTCSNTAVLDYPLPVAVPPGTTVTCTPPPGTVVPVGVYGIVCVASNDCGTAACQFAIAVRPTPQVRIQCPTNPIVAVVPCGSNCVPVIYPDPVVSNGALISCIPPSGTCLPVGNHVVLCRASNDCSTAGCEFVVHVLQGGGEPPHINCPTAPIVLTTCSNCAPFILPTPL